MRIGSLVEIEQCRMHGINVGAWVPEIGIFFQNTRDNFRRCGPGERGGALASAVLIDTAPPSSASIFNAVERQVL